MEQRDAYGIYRSMGWSQVEAAWAAVHGPVPRSEAEPEHEREAGG